MFSRQDLKAREARKFPPRISRMSADIRRLRKNSAGRRCEQKALQKRFLAQPDGQHGLGRVLPAQHGFS
jgi:hypothetical protein